MKYIVNDWKLSSNHSKLEMTEKGKFIFFDTDEEFCDYAINPEMKFTKLDDGVYVHNLDYTEEYLDAVNANKYFVIKNRDSKIAKHNAVSMHTITKPVKNIISYRDYEFSYRSKGV